MRTSVLAADMPWVDGVIERLSALGVRQATLDRFDAAYRRRALNFTRGQNNIAKDFASALEGGVEQWIASVDGRRLVLRCRQRHRVVTTVVVLVRR